MDNKTLQKDLKNREEWSDDSLLKFNEDKCVQMPISHAISDHTARIYWQNGKQFEKVKGEKDLGVTIDSKFFIWVAHFQKIKKVSSIIAIFKKTFKRNTSLFSENMQGSHSTSSWVL